MMKRVICAVVLMSILMPPGITAQAQLPGAARVDLQQPPVTGSLQLTLKRAVDLALERNPALIVEKIHIEQARERIREEDGAFDPLLNLKGSAARRDNIVASRFYPTGFYFDSEQAPGVSLESKTEWGGKLTFGLDYKRLLSTSNTQTLSPQYSANFTAGITQPLLRDFGRKINQTRTLVAVKQSDIAENNLFQKISQLIQSVEEIYWNLVFFQDDLAGKKSSLEVAQQLLKQSEDLFRAGIVAQNSVLEARSGVASREEELITAESDMRRFEDRLKVLLWIDLSAASVNAIDRPKEGPVDLDESKLVENALSGRLEIQGLATELEQRQLELKFADNQTRPRLDVAAQWGVTGMSGLPSTACIDPTSVICEPVGGSITDSIFAGRTSPKDALNSLLTLHPFENWSVEVKLQLPLGNRTADARRSEANLQLLDTTARLRAVRDQITMEVRDAIRDSQTSRKRIDASRETIKYVDEQLSGARKRLEAGLASTYDVLEVLGQLDKARTNELKAVMDYNVAQSKVGLAEASNLGTYDIEVKKLPRFGFRQTTTQR